MKSFGRQHELSRRAVSATHAFGAILTVQTISPVESDFDDRATVALPRFMLIPVDAAFACRAADLLPVPIDFKSSDVKAALTRLPARIAARRSEQFDIVFSAAFDYQI